MNEEIIRQLARAQSQMLNVGLSPYAAAAIYGTALYKQSEPVESKLSRAQAYAAEVRRRKGWIVRGPMEPMPPGTKSGSKIRFSFPENGYEFDQERLKELGFKVGDIFTVEQTDIHQSFTTLYLKEFPNHRFNTVNFSLVGDSDE